MNRNAVIALTIAAVLGTTGGVAVATLRGDHPNSGAPSGSATPGTPTPPPTPTTPPTNEPLLYATGEQIHDGKTVVPIKGPTNVANLNRIPGGYLVLAQTKPEEPRFDVWVIKTSGESYKIADIHGFADIDAEGKRLVARTYRDPNLSVWDLPTGKLIATSPDEATASSSAAFAGDDVLISLMRNDGFSMLRWNPASGEVTDDSGLGYVNMSLSPGGSYVTGSVNEDGISAVMTDNFCLALRSTHLKKNKVAWETCDYRAYGSSGQAQFSPDGMRVLVVPKNTDGFGPGEYVVIDASDGPGKIVGRFLTPENTIGAKWADNDHLFVFGALQSDPDTSAVGSFIDRCDFKGKCERLLTDPGELRVGSGL